MAKIAHIRVTAKECLVPGPVSPLYGTPFTVLEAISQIAFHCLSVGGGETAEGSLQDRNAQCID